MVMDWNPDKRFSFKEDEEAMAILDEIAEQEGKSRSAKLRELVREEVAGYVDDSDDADDLPSDERLCDAYKTLISLADERVPGAGLRVSREEARNSLYSNRVPKDAVMDSLIRPLRQRGYVDIDASMSRVWITVRPRSSQAGTDMAPSVVG